jgi:hypothetical protein
MADAAFIEPITLARTLGRIRPRLADRGLIGLFPFQGFKQAGPAVAIIQALREGSDAPRGALNQ